MRTSGLALLAMTGAVAALATTAVASATAAPPVQAKITFGSGMAGATLGRRTTEVKADRTLGPAPFSGWGRLADGGCFEGTLCRWGVRGPGDVFIVRSASPSRQTIVIATSAPGWKTSKGVGPGTTVTTLRARYPGLTKLTTCGLEGFGGANKGYRYGKHSFFEVAGGNVTAVYVTRVTIRASSRCA